MDVCSNPNEKYHCRAKVHERAFRNPHHPLAIPTAPPAGDGFGPPDLASAYNFNPALDPHATVAVVDVYSYAALETDLAAYRSAFGLPACGTSNGCLTIVDNGGGQEDASGWGVETALDVDMASAACPNCKLLVILADPSTDSSLDDGNATAAQMGATVISNSWGGNYDKTSDPQYEQTDFNQPGVAIFVAAGDDGYTKTADYPSTSEHVIAVGGTNLTKDSSTRGWTETAWGLDAQQNNGAGGSSCQKDTTNFPKPSWQTNVVTTTVCAGRAATDVAAVADPQTSVAVYNDSQGGWLNGGVGGTSAASPLTAGIFALTGNGSADGSFSYAHTTAFNDVTTGTNEASNTCSGLICNAAAGWDGPTGNGTPNGAAMAAISGEGSGEGSGSGSGSGSNEGSGSNQGSDGNGDGNGSGSGSDDGNGDNGDGGNGNGGGGGCSTTGGAGGATFLFALGLAVAGRRRRRA
ncbi:MAG TPA: MYXO-CTERM sorting domain-containing protein [Kofleriaceae bacterium]